MAETTGTPEGATPPTVQLASLPRQWRAEAQATSPGAAADLGDSSDVRRVAYAAALLDCAQELQAVLSISPRGCWEHPGIPGYQHPECGFHWHGKDGLDVPTAGEGANREPICPRCQTPASQPKGGTLKCPDCSTPLVDRTGVILWCPKCQLAFPQKDFPGAAP